MLVRCGGGGEGTPSPPLTPPPAFPGGTVLSFVSGETNDPVGGATVSIGTATYTSSEAGTVTPREPVSRGAGITVLAAGFLDRKTLSRSAGETVFSLWPRTSRTGLDEAWTQQLVYTPGAYCCPATQQLGEMWMERARSGTVISLTVAAGSTLQRDTVRSAAQMAADLVSAANEGRVIFQFSPAPTSGPKIDIEVATNVCGTDPTPAACMAVDLDYAGYITGGRMVFPADPVQTAWWAQVTSRSYFPGEEGYFEQLIAHELGHALGLQHSLASVSDGRLGLMALDSQFSYSLSYFSSFRDFAPAEKLAMKLMYQRRAGNRFPDDETGVSASTMPPSVIVCRMPPPTAN